MGMSAAKSLSSLSLGPERKVKCYNEYFVIDMCYIMNNTGMEKRHITTVFVLKDRLVVS
jgi:hypothetical protein